MAGGLSISQMKKENLLKKAIDEALFLEKKYMICYWPWPDSGNDKKLLMI